MQSQVEQVAMSSFNPTQVTLEPPDRPDQLAGAVMQSLSRPIARRRVWGPLFSLVVGGISIGILPLIVWPRRFAQFVVAEEQQLWHLSEWLRLNTGDPDAAALSDLTRRIAAPFTLYLIPWLLAGVVLVQLYPMLGLSNPHLSVIHTGITNFYHQSWNLNFLRHGFNTSYPPERRQIICTLSLFLAFGSHWLHVRSHAADVQSVVAKMNPILVRQGLQPVQTVNSAHMDAGWMIVMVAGVCWGAWWAIPAAIAGAAHQQYAARTSMQIRGDMAQRLRSLLLRQRPALDVPTPFRFREVCTNRLCRQSLRNGATFCPRCGSRMADKLDAVA
jgi:hypothetical protein